MYSLLKKIDTHYIGENKAKEYSPNLDMFVNLNTKEELEAYIQENKLNKNSLSK